MSQWLYRLQPTRPALLTDGPTETEQRLIGEHFAYLRALTEQGVVFLAGRTLTTDTESFGLCIFQAETEAAACSLMENDPAVKHGVMKATLFPYRIALWSNPSG